MRLYTQETKLKVYHHHVFFFILRGLQLWAASLPFFLLAYFFLSLMTSSVYWTINLSIVALFVTIHFYDFIMYYFDTLVVTNHRLVHRDWIHPFRCVETEAMLNDIQNIKSVGNGFLSKFPLFDFGVCLIETASTKTVIHFPEAPDPEGIKVFITNIVRKHYPLHKNHASQPTNSITQGNSLALNQETQSQNTKVA